MKKIEQILFVSFIFTPSLLDECDPSTSKRDPSTPREFVCRGDPGDASNKVGVFVSQSHTTNGRDVVATTRPDFESLFLLHKE